ncbi:hypothetical protein B0H14DRAFT_2658348 [Mycena olivaceomarginata]|nr:hypothetical protein B0H14DRAFT_2658348 [Mycena olivaceomarginata]
MDRNIITILNSLKAKHRKVFTDAIHTFLQMQKPFLEAKFSFVTKSLGLSEDPQDPFAGWADLAPEIPSVLLPSSIVKRILRSTVDSFTFQAIVCLFGGVLRDRPEKSVPRTGLSSGGKVEGEVFCKDQMLIFLRELKHRLGGKEFADYVAQTQGLQGMGEYFEHTLKAPSPVYEYTFTVLLNGYYHTLQIYYEQTVSRGEKGDLQASAPGSHRAVTMLPIPPPMGEHIDHLSTQGWQSALGLAYEASSGHGRRNFEPCTPSMAEQKTNELFNQYLKTLCHDPDTLWQLQFPGVFSLTTQEWRKQAVDEFWGSLPVLYRQRFKPNFLFNGNSHSSLAMTAHQHPDLTQLGLAGIGSKFEVNCLLIALDKSRESGHWGIIVS